MAASMGKAASVDQTAGGDHPLDAFMHSNLGVVFPAAVLLVLQGGQAIWRRAYGWLDPGSEQYPTRLDSLFDLASLTKLFTASAFMRLVEVGKVALETRVADVLPAFRGQRLVGATEDPLRNILLPADPRYAGQPVDLDQISFRHLLTHTSGMAAWRSVYSVSPERGEIPLPHHIPAERRARRIQAIYAYDFACPPGSQVIYSDLGYILLGEALQTLSGMALETAIQREVLDPLGLKQTMYNPLAHRASLTSLAPAEVCGWRRRRLVGEVDDENAASLSGVAGHAGLFSNAEEVARLGQIYLDGGRCGAAQLLSPESVAEMTRQQVHQEGQRRGLGWVLQTPAECSCGNLFGARSFGHTGFTGTSLWVDPDRELVVVALTNRVYYGRGSDAILRFRPALHDLIIQTLVEASS